MASSMEDYTVQAIIIIFSAAVVFVAGIIVHAFVIVANIVDWMRGRSLASTDQIITSLEISRIIFMLSSLFGGVRKILSINTLQIIISVQFVRVSASYSCVWFLTLLSVVFCLKISNFHSVFFHYLKSIISARIIHLIVGSVFLSVIHSSLNVWITYFEFVRNNTVDFTLDFTNPKVHKFFLWNSVPFLMCLLAAVLLIAYLSLHVRRMKREAQITHLGSYYKAIYFTTMSFFICVIRIFININPNYYDSYMYVILNTLPIFHSIFLIFSVKKLKDQLFWSLQQWTKCWSVIRGCGTSFCGNH